VTSRHLVIFIVTSLMTFDVCLKTIIGQQQQPVQFLPINNWNCSGQAEKICAVDAASEMLEASGLTECIMQCWINSPHCLQ